MEILKNFGFDPVMLVAQIINFLIIFYLLKRFLYKPVFEMLKKRQDTISNSLKQAEEIKITLEKTIEEEKKILLKAQNEGKNIIDEARLQAIEIAKEIEENAKKQTEKMIVEARQQIEYESKEVESQISEKVSILASEMLTKSLEGIFSAKEQKQILNKSFKQIKKVN
nr:F0F1 ATP synthase subunit B [Candidatus Levybacteria bacterium]